jgi:molybdopterin molybdotransferase
MDQIHLFDKAVDIIEHLPLNQRVRKQTVTSALGSVLAEDAVAHVHVPPFAKAMMDGFAVKGADVHSKGARLTVIASVAAGSASTTRLAHGQAARIMTGAPLPDGADTVIRFEWVEQSEDGHQIEILKPAEVGESVQRLGEDGLAGTSVLSKGSPLTGPNMAVLRTFGISQVSVYELPRISVIVTGSELVPTPDQALQPGQIYGANDALIVGALREDGIAVHRVQYVKDDLQQLVHALAEETKEADYVLITGGVSAGDFDYTPAAIAEVGAHIAIRKILMRPGSPFVAATHGKCIIFGLSGNPAACFAQFETLIHPVLRRFMGLSEGPFPHSGVLSHDIDLKHIKHTRILRAQGTIANGVVHINSELAQSSGIISSFSAANCLIRLNESKLSAGTVVPLRWFRQP